jgi:hypothetical protein
MGPMITTRQQTTIVQARIKTSNNFRKSDLSASNFPVGKNIEDVKLMLNHRIFWKGKMITTKRQDRLLELSNSDRHKKPAIAIID